MKQAKAQSENAMRHYSLTLPTDDDGLGESIVNALSRGVKAGKVIPHTPAGAVGPGAVLEFDTADPLLQRIIELTKASGKVQVESVPVDGEHAGVASL